MTMPFYIYRCVNEIKCCDFCRQEFEVFQSVKDETLAKCPKCRAAVKKIITGFSTVESKTGFDRRAKDQGFHKLKKVDKGKYEKLY